jgi:nitroimidazol reductase NimA-like FMN-containing flavoprotein (pyridoxamine 5'-phosphate oxidase superfamily)
MDDIRRDGRVSFEVDVPIAYVRAKSQPCEATYLFRSVIVKGRAHLVDDEAEKVAALNLLMEKYQPEGGYGSYPPQKLAAVGVVRIDVEEMTGKEDLRDGGLREAALRALEEGQPLPLALDRP